MRMRRTGGYVLHSPLSFVFQMMELGGSAVQKYSSLDKAYIPDRIATPYVLKPQLMLTDPEGNLPAGEYTKSLQNVLWTVTSYMNGTTENVSTAGTYSADNGYQLTINRNVRIGETLHVEFSADYINENIRGKSHFEWRKDLTAIAEDLFNVSLYCERPKGKLLLYPMKDRGEIVFNTQLYNGDKVLADDVSIYHWQKWDWDNNKYVDIDEDDFWYVSGKDGKALTVEQKYVNKVRVRLTAYATGAPEQKQYMSYFLKRWYGQWEEDAYFVYGKYIFNDTKTIGIAASMVNHNGGEIANPEKYFDIELFYRHTSTAQWRSVGYSGEAIVTRSSGSTDHQCGIIARELTALQPLQLPDGTFLCDDDGNPIMVQSPVSDRDLSEDEELKQVVIDGKALGYQYSEVAIEDQRQWQAKLSEQQQIAQ